MTGSLADAIVKRVKDTLDRNKASSVPELGTIDVLYGTGAMAVRVGTRTTNATPATEEPFRNGETVWTARTKQGTTIIHGGLR